MIFSYVKLRRADQVADIFYKDDIQTIQCKFMKGIVDHVCIEVAGTAGTDLYRGDPFPANPLGIVRRGDRAFDERHVVWPGDHLARRLQEVRHVDDADAVEVPPDLAEEHLEGQAIDSVERHGRYVVVRFRSGANLVFHMGSEGRIFLESQTTPPDDDSRIRLQFAAGRELRYAAPGDEGEIHLVDGEDFSGLGTFERLGLDPLSEDFTAEVFVRLANRLSDSKPRTSLKAILMNQEIVAGIGNEYADEICFQASIRPDCKMADLSDEQLTQVHKYLRRVLRRATLHWQAAHSCSSPIPQKFPVMRSGPRWTG